MNSELAQARERAIDIMRYQGLPLCSIDQIAYRVGSSGGGTPESVIESGGFVPRAEGIVSRNFTGVIHRALTSMSFVPEITALWRHTGKYMYAVLVDKGYILDRGQWITGKDGTHYFEEGDWKQVAAPGVPVEKFLIARQIISADDCKMGLGVTKVFFPQPGDKPEEIVVTSHEELCDIIAARFPHDPKIKKLDLANDETLKRFVTSHELTVPINTEQNPDYKGYFCCPFTNPIADRQFFSGRSR